MMDLEALHDATLVSLEIGWRTGEIRCHLKTSNEDKPAVVLVAQNFSVLKCPRLFPWGRSVSVNGITAEEQGSQSLLVIEMQSGDRIEATVGTWRLE